MAMLYLQGEVYNELVTPSGTNKKGEAYGGLNRVQILGENQLQNGETRFDLINLTVDNPPAYKSLHGQMVRIPVGAFLLNGSIQFYALKNVNPELVTAKEKKDGK